MTNRSITIIFSLMLFASLAYLATAEYLQTQDITHQNWWALYFEDPKGKSLDVTIDNPGASAEFRWEIYLEKNLVSDGSATIDSGQKKTVPIRSTDLVGRKVTIAVFKGEEKRELYKIIK